MFLALIAVWHLFAAVESLDSQMTQEEKKETGIYKLNTSQKAALQQWIDTYCEKKALAQAGAPQQSPNKSPILSENLMNSRFLKLSDNTLWSVRPEDVPIAQGWIT